MDEYIKRTDAMAVICSFCGLDKICEDRTVCRIQKKLHELPAVDVRPVVHGKWDWIYPLAQCSNCKKAMILTDYSNFCSNCGADMREAE